MNYSAFHRLTYGLYLIATEFERQKAGYIANTAFQITAEPSKIAISCNKNNFSAEMILKSKKFSISVLKKEVDTSLIGKFGFMSGADFDKFQGVETLTAKTGAPIVVDSSIAWFDCTVLDSIDVGTHILIIGEVVDADVLSKEEPLTYAYYHAKYKMRSPKNAPTYIDDSKLEEEDIPIITEDETDVADEKGGDSEEYVCKICGYRYNPEEGDPSMGIPPGTPFEELPDDYCCPICNADKDFFSKV